MITTHSCCQDDYCVKIHTVIIKPSTILIKLFNEAVKMPQRNESAVDTKQILSLEFEFSFLFFGGRLNHVQMSELQHIKIKHSVQQVRVEILKNSEHICGLLSRKSSTELQESLLPHFNLIENSPAALCATVWLLIIKRLQSDEESCTNFPPQRQQQRQLTVLICGIHPPPAGAFKQSCPSLVTSD